MSSTSPVALIRAADGRLYVLLKDGREVSIELISVPGLVDATDAELQNWEPSGAGRGLHWPSVDVDLSLEWLLRDPDWTG
jgi:hypothetical protein